MRYRSNLKAPDLRPHFEATTEWRVRDWSMGHDIPSDKLYEPECGFLSDDEAAILYNVAQPGQIWTDIGSRMAWSTAHIALRTDATVLGVDHAYFKRAILGRALQNGNAADIDAGFSAKTAAEYFAETENMDLDGFMIDGDHDAPQPLNDARGALAHLAETGVIVFHDFWGRPIREGVEYLLEQGLKCRVYNTPAGMAVCWRGDFAPPDHVPDPEIDWVHVRVSRAGEFDFGRCE